MGMIMLNLTIHMAFCLIRSNMLNESKQMKELKLEELIVLMCWGLGFDLDFDF